jgi:hypothetical protein
MPRKSQMMLRCAIYLYMTVEDAENSEKEGGSGFIAAWPFSPGMSSDWAHLYAITNSHVIVEGKAPVIRVNDKQGGKCVLPFRAEDWTLHPNRDDVAVCPLAINSDTHNIAAVSVEHFVTKESVSAHYVGIGDEVCMASRLSHLAGKEQNLPIVRFGHIAMLPIEPVTNPLGIRQESFLIETLSLTGFSGSPVFWDEAMPILHTYREECPDLNVAIERRVRPGWLLGMDWGHLRDKKPIMDREGYPMEDAGYYEVNSGIATVLPAWKIREVLELPEFVEQRERDEHEWLKERANSSAVFDTLSSEPAPFEKFENLAWKAMQTSKLDAKPKDMPEAN